MNRNSSLPLAETAAIKSLYNRLIKSWNETDADTYASLFSEDGSLVGFDGSMANNREEIYEHLSGIFADHKPANYITIIKDTRMLSSTVGFLKALAGMVPPDKDKINPKTNAIQTLIAIKENDEFRIMHFQNTPAAFHGRPEAVEELTKQLQEEFDHR